MLEPTQGHEPTRRHTKTTATFGITATTKDDEDTLATRRGCKGARPSTQTSAPTTQTRSATKGAHDADSDYEDSISRSAIDQRMTNMADDAEARAQGAHIGRRGGD